MPGLEYLKPYKLIVPRTVDGAVKGFVSRIIELSTKLTSERRQVCLVIDGRVPKAKVFGDFEYQYRCDKYKAIVDGLTNGTIKDPLVFEEKARKCVRFSTDVKQAIVRVNINMFKQAHMRPCQVTKSSL